MARITVKQPAGIKSFSFDAPEEGEVFRPTFAPQGEIFTLQGGKLFRTDLEQLGRKLFTGTSQEFSRTSVAERQRLGRQFLQGQGVDDKNIQVKDFNLSDLKTAFGSQQLLTDFNLLKGKPTTQDTQITIGEGGTLPTQQELQAASDKRIGVPQERQITPTQPKVPTAHTIQPGDTLSKLATKFGTDISTLLQLNPQIKDPNLIFAGAELNLPATSPEVSAGVTKQVEDVVATGKDVLKAGEEFIAGQATSKSVVSEIDQIDDEQQEEEEEEATTIADSGIDVATRDSQELLANLVKTLEGGKDGGVPEAPDLEALFASKSAELGIEPLETQLADIDSDIERIQTQLLVQAEQEGERLVSVAQIGRRRGKLQQEAEQRIALLNVERSAVARQLNNKIETLNSVLKITQQDFANASAQYNSEFTKNLQLINLLEQFESNEISEAKANLNTIINIAKDSGKSFADLDSDTQRQIKTLELQAGLPAGIFETFMTARPNDKIISTVKGTNEAGEDIVTFVYQDPETGRAGTVEIVKTGGVEEAKKTGDADAIIAENSELTDDELKQKLLDETELSPTDVNVRIKNRLSDDDINFEAEELVADFFETKFFKGKGSELEDAKAKAIEDIEEGGIISIDGKDIRLTSEVQERIKTAINLVEIDTVQDIRKARK